MLMPSTQSSRASNVHRGTCRIDTSVYATFLTRRTSSGRERDLIPDLDPSRPRGGHVSPPRVRACARVDLRDRSRDTHERQDDYHTRFVKLCKVQLARGKLLRVPRRVEGCNTGTWQRKCKCSVSSKWGWTIALRPERRSRCVCRHCAGGEYQVVRNNRESCVPLRGVKLRLDLEIT